jgi:hypothetical protein
MIVYTFDSSPQRALGMQNITILAYENMSTELYSLQSVKSNISSIFRTTDEQSRIEYTRDFAALGDLLEGTSVENLDLVYTNTAARPRIINSYRTLSGLWIHGINQKE